MREESFLDQFWNKINPKGLEVVERDMLFEFMKLMFDPYFKQLNIQAIISELVEVIKNISLNDDSFG